MQRNFRRSRRGHLSSRASSRTLWLKSSQESSRFRSGVSGAAAGAASSSAVTGRVVLLGQRRRILLRGGRLEEQGIGLDEDVGVSLAARALLVTDHAFRSFIPQARHADGLAQRARQLAGDRLDGPRLDPLDHDPGEELGPGIADENAAAPGDPLLGARHQVRRSPGCSRRGSLSRTFTFRRTWGARTRRGPVARGTRVAATEAATWRPVRVPSPVVVRSARMRCPDCSPPRSDAEPVHLLHDVAVADGGADEPDPAGGQGLLEPPVRHDRPDDGAGLLPLPLELERPEEEDVVAVEDAPLAVGEHRAIGVAVEGQPEVGPGLHDGFGHGIRMEGAAARVDVVPVGGDGERDHVGPGAPERLRRDPEGGAVRAVDDDPEAVEAGRERVDEVGLVEVGQSRVFRHLDRRRRPRPSR